MTAIGLFFHNHHLATDPAAAGRIAAVAEELGYDSIWAGEHVVLPSPRVAPSPMEATDPILDPLVLLAHLAARTERVRLATGVVILPQRNPLVLAKQVASLDVVSGGRVTLGIGAGYLWPELDAVGAPPELRGARTDAYLAAMRSLWEDAAPAADGPHVRFTGVDAHPRPVQRPLPIVVGGSSPAALRRAVRSAQGWYGFRLSPTALAAAMEHLHRPERPLEISVTPDRRLDPATVRAYTDAGADRLVVHPPPNLDEPALERYLRANAFEGVLSVPARTLRPCPPASTKR